jgi:sugar phosphate isomerase/epimerase
MMSYTMARQGFSVKDIISTAAKLNLKGIDWVTTYGYEPAELRKMSLDGGLEIACYTFFAEKLLAGESNWLDEVKKSIDDAVALGAPIVMIPTGVNENMPRKEFRHFWSDALREIAPVCDQAGVILTIENYPGKDSAFVTASDFLEARKYVPQLKLTYDNGNAASGENPLTSLELCKEDIVHVHFKDWYISDSPVDGYREMLNGKFYKSALIGQGDVPTTACFKALEAIDYKGFINIEYESDDVSADKAVEQAVNFLNSLRAE